jgi:hypothetical protein
MTLGTGTKYVSQACTSKASTILHEFQLVFFSEDSSDHCASVHGIWVEGGTVPRVVIPWIVPPIVSRVLSLALSSVIVVSMAPEELPLL